MGTCIDKVVKMWTVSNLSSISFTNFFFFMQGYNVSDLPISSRHPSLSFRMFSSNPRRYPGSFFQDALDTSFLSASITKSVWVVFLLSLWEHAPKTLIANLLYHLPLSVLATSFLLLHHSLFFSLICLPPSSRSTFSLPSIDFQFQL